MLWAKFVVLPGFLYLLPVFVYAGEYKPFRDTSKTKYKKVYFTQPRFIQLGIYGGMNTNENFEFGLSIPIVNHAQFPPLKAVYRKNFSLHVDGFNSMRNSSSDNQRVDRYLPVKPFPNRLAIQFGLEKGIVSKVYRPSFGILLTPFSMFGYMYNQPFRASSGFYYRYWLNHVLVDASYLPSVREFNDTWKVGGGIMWRLPFRKLSWRQHINLRLMAMYHYRIEEHNPFNHNEFTFALHVTGWEGMFPRGYRIGRDSRYPSKQ